MLLPKLSAETGLLSLARFEHVLLTGSKVYMGAVQTAAFCEKIVLSVTFAKTNLIVTGNVPIANSAIQFVRILKKKFVYVYTTRHMFVMDVLMSVSAPCA